VRHALSGPIGFRRAVALLILVAGGAFGTIVAQRSLRDDRTTLASVAAAPRANGRLALFHNSTDQFVDYVRGLVPDGAPIRILHPTKPAQPGLVRQP
jgi:hypothetical protein